MNSISNYNDIGCIHDLNSLVNSISNSKKFSLGRSDIYNIIDCFLNFVDVMTLDLAQVAT